LLGVVTEAEAFSVQVQFGLSLYSYQPISGKAYPKVATGPRRMEMIGRETELSPKSSWASALPTHDLKQPGEISNLEIRKMTEYCEPLRFQGSIFAVIMVLVFSSLA
jgi:hypothetical protein